MQTNRLGVTARPSTTSAIVLVSLLAACGSDAPLTADATPGAFGTVVATGGASVPATGNVLAIWAVSSGSPDYLYKFGDGTSTGAAVTMEFPVAPPPAALNLGASGFGVGVLTLYPAPQTYPDGVITDAQFQTGMLGASSNYAVIYKAPGANALAWLANFPTGYSCGRCVPVTGLDSWEPVSCDAAVIDVVPDVSTLLFCNWT
ncbi:hypothetical protein BH11MYX1_BH11MYX1_32990 [soil metagenome]